MTFKDVVIKNFMVNIKKYCMCFLCSSFSIMIVFMYSTLLFNNIEFQNEGDKDAINLLLYIALGAVIVFSVFFVNYSTNSFLKSRYKEFGILMTMGLNRKDIFKIVILENSIVFLSSLCIGLISGSVFSRLFKMIIADIMNLKNMEYELNIYSFIFTIGIFLIIFITEILMFILFVRKLTIEQLIKKESENQGRFKKRTVSGVIGLVIAVVDSILIINLGNNENLRSNIYFDICLIIVLFISIYIIISSFGSTIIALFKSVPSLYNKNIIVITSINKKFNDKKMVLFILTMLCALAIFSVVPPIALIKECKSVVELQKHDMEITSVYGINQIDKEKIDEIAGHYGIEIYNAGDVEFIPLNYESRNKASEITSKKIVMSETEYNHNSEYQVNVNKGKAVKFVTSWTPDNDNMIVGDNISLSDNNFKIEVEVSDIVSNKWICNDKTLPCKSVLVLNDEDYKEIRENISEESIGCCNFYKLSEWEGQDDFIEELRNNIINNVSEDGQEFALFADNYMFMSKPELLNSMKQGYKLFLFMTSMMGILFFIASAAVLFFNQYLEIEDSKKKIDKLYKIGIEAKEIKSIISKEILVTFFVPVVFGSLCAAVLMNFTAKLVGGSEMIDQFMNSAYKVIILYFIIQILLYFFTRFSYIKKCLIKEHRK